MLVRRLRNPLPGNLQGGVCGKSVGVAMVDLNGHEAGNGGYSEGRPTARRVLLCSERCPVSAAFNGHLFSIHRPNARGSHFDQMTVGVSKVQAPASQSPLPLFFHCDSSRLEP
jgi:hypothetical protein